MRLTLGFSPCPNDTFIFDALVNKKINTEGLEFDVFYRDVEKLNQWALTAKLDITKVSYNAFTECFDKYAILSSGSALGNNCGPLLIKKPDTELSSNSIIGIPGRLTTANMLMDFAYPDYQNKIELPFSDIEKNILTNVIDGGVIIHESRFTYQDKGLKKVKDLGEYWKRATNFPIPLGGIALKRNLPEDIKKKIDRILIRSIHFAFQYKRSSLGYIKKHAQEMSEEVIHEHIKLYVNQFSVSLGDEGRNAIKKLFELKGFDSSNIFF